MKDTLDRRRLTNGKADGELRRWLRLRRHELGDAELVVRTLERRHQSVVRANTILWTGAGIVIGATSITAASGTTVLVPTGLFASALVLVLAMVMHSYGLYKAEQLQRADVIMQGLRDSAAAEANDQARRGWLGRLIRR